MRDATVTWPVGDLPFLEAIRANPADEAHKKVFADYLDETGRPDEAKAYREWKAGRVIPELDTYDWRETFGYADGTAYHADKEGHVRKAAPHLDVSEAKFSREDVAEIIAIREGENDVANWFCAGRLLDGRWFAVDAGCDCTGWD
jgi:uncharacterized protein (TIGR02996 family)